jgi:hypothetical protein
MKRGVPKRRVRGKIGKPSNPAQGNAPHHITTLNLAHFFRATFRRGWSADLDSPNQSKQMESENHTAKVSIAYIYHKVNGTERCAKINFPKGEYYPLY